jgi:hypothetical protein
LGARENIMELNRRIIATAAKVFLKTEFSKKEKKG